MDIKCKLEFPKKNKIKIHTQLINCVNKNIRSAVLARVTQSFCNDIFTYM